MSSYISGWYNSVKGMLGYENLEVESGGGAEEKVNNAASEERKGLWKQLSSYLGQDVTSLISLPVWIFEPLSFLQIMCEPLQYADLLHKASETPDSFERMGYLIAFISAGYSCAVRQRKPFNPILGETFEFIPRDKSFKFFAEQVSHHPPIGVATAVCGGFTLLLEMELKTKFKGNSSDVMVDGSNHITFHKFNDKITWGHLSTCAYNVIIGGMWVDHFGTIELKNETTGDKGVLTFTKAGWLGAGRFQTQAQIFDKAGNLRLKLQGAWNDSIYAIKVNNGVEGVPTLIWKHGTIDNTKWNWSKFTTELNVMSDSYKSILPATDSRVRSDRYYLEKGDLDTAGKEKHKLEEKQRAERREREAKGEAYTPKYFKSVNDATWGHKYDYIGSYWEERAQRISSKGHKAEDFETSFCSPASVNQVSNDLANLEIK